MHVVCKHVFMSVCMSMCVCAWYVLHFVCMVCIMCMIYGSCKLLAYATLNAMSSMVAILVLKY